MVVKFTNNAKSNLAAAISDSDTSILISTDDAGKFPVLADGDWFPLTLVKSTGEMEIVRVTARVGAALTVVRAQETTVARAFDMGTAVSLRLTVALLAEFSTRINTKVDKVGDTMSGALLVPAIQLNEGISEPADAPMIYNESGSDNIVFRTGPKGAYKFTELTSDGVLTLTARPSWGATPWDSENFDPATKVNLAGGIMTGALEAPELRSKGTVSAGAAVLGTNGNISGSGWQAWGSSSAFDAINARIEERSLAWANNRVSNLQYRKVSPSLFGRGAFNAPVGAVITGLGTGLERGEFINGTYHYLQVFDPVRGWVGFSG